jgi:hypothetical protein
VASLTRKVILNSRGISSSSAKCNQMMVIQFSSQPHFRLKEATQSLVEQRVIVVVVGPNFYFLALKYLR